MLTEITLDCLLDADTFEDFEELVGSQYPGIWVDHDDYIMAVKTVIDYGLLNVTYPDTSELMKIVSALEMIINTAQNGDVPDDRFYMAQVVVASFGESVEDMWLQNMVELVLMKSWSIKMITLQQDNHQKLKVEVPDDQIENLILKHFKWKKLGEHKTWLARLKTIGSCDYDAFIEKLHPMFGVLK